MIKRTYEFQKDRLAVRRFWKPLQWVHSAEMESWIISKPQLHKLFKLRVGRGISTIVVRRVFGDQQARNAFTGRRLGKSTFRVGCQIFSGPIVKKAQRWCRG